MEFYNEKVKPWMGIIALIAIGALMLKDPDAFSSADISGRKQFIKLIFSYIWGIPAGIIMILLGGYLGYKQFTGQAEE